MIPIIRYTIFEVNQTKMERNQKVVPNNDNPQISRIQQFGSNIKILNY